MTSSAAAAVRERVTARPVGGPVPRVSSRLRKRDHLWPLGLYTLLSLGLFGYPILLHLGSRIIASDPIDSSQFIWFFAWWPYALLHGLNPFVTHAIFAPNGFNLSWATAMPGPSLVLAPITEIFNGEATYNVVQLACPALSAWTAFLLCRHVTDRLGPSLVGGYVFGFSPYILHDLTGAPYLGLVPLLPVFVLLVLRRLDGSMSQRRFAVWMALALAAQYSISSEVLLSSTLFGGIAIVIAFVLFAGRRRAMFDVVKLLAVSYIAAVILISPFLYYFFVGTHYPPGATYGWSPAAAYVVPPPNVVALTRHSPALAGSNDEAYLGLPLIVVVCLYLWERRRDRTAWLIVVSLLVPAICSLGPTLRVRSQFTSISLPWHLLGRLPLLRYLNTIRFSVFVFLGAAVILAIWLSRAPERGRGAIMRWSMAVLVVASIFPDIGSSIWATTVNDPPFFASGAYRKYLRPSDHVLTIPAYGPNERWQADTGFRFQLADGYAGNPFPASYTKYPIWYTLVSTSMIPGYAAQLRRFVNAKGVTAIVVDETQPGPWRQLFGTLGVRPISTGGVLFYRLGASS